MPPRKKKKINPNAPEQGNEAVYYKSNQFEDLNRRTRKKLVKDQQTENQGGLLKTRRGKTVIYQSKNPENKALKLNSLSIQPTTTFNSDANNALQQSMKDSSAYRDALGNNYTSKSAYEAGQRAALNTITQSGRDELNTPTQLLNAPTTRAQANFSGSDQLIGSIAGDWTSTTPTSAEVASGAQRANISSGSFTTTGDPFQPRPGQRASTVIDTRTGGAVTNNVPDSDLRSQLGSINNLTQMGNLDSQGRGRVFDFVEGATGFEDSDAMAAAAKNSKYSPVKVGSHSTRDYDLSSNDGGRMLTAGAGTALQNSVFRGIGQPQQGSRISGVTKVAPEFEYNPVSGKDSYAKLQVEKTTSPIKIHKSANKLKGVFLNSKIKRGKQLESRKNKVQKVKGAVDLDMDGVIGNTRLERNAKAFAGVDNIYSTRRAAKREVKYVNKKKKNNNYVAPEKTLKKMAQGEQKMLHKKDFKYLINGEDKGADKFNNAQNFNVRKFNKNQANFNTQHMNQGIGQNTLTGADGYAARFNVNKNDAFGTGAVIGKHNLDKNIDQKKYKKLQKRLDSKVLGKFYRK